ncbi:MAG: pyridoxamine 5'-phosphate oxidase family protein [Clostridiaceae bacterium]
MRRKDREITEINEIIEIMKKCDSCSVAFHDEVFPYIIPMSFGFEQKNGEISLYFHSALDGKKLDLIRRNGHAAFEMSCSHKLITGDSACSFTMEYESVCGNGHMEILDREHKINALSLLMRQYVDEQSFKFEESILDRVVVMKLNVNELHGKHLKR